MFCFPSSFFNLRLPPKNPLNYPILKAFLCLDIGLITANMLLELQQLSRELNLSLEEVLGIHVVGRGVAAVLLDVETDGSA